jgi:hypothetical protein
MDAMTRDPFQDDQSIGNSTIHTTGTMAPVRKVLFEGTALSDRSIGADAQEDDEMIAPRGKEVAPNVAGAMDRDMTDNMSAMTPNTMGSHTPKPIHNRS